ncbi:AAA family ATPase [Pseudofrankia sp. BMG5.37]|uniref:AAA family ATPase n=1 Tax=Pseudofrankia sp. BMG5.37 TaxID=3050035 RepID=UPI00289425FB|nr:AAA family ATPase [Pseudofrankia sp. BMG5.37]MDT3439009.1 AAA family ATPase [Pseudofrankia sp. BMG5.37]
MTEPTVARDELYEVLFDAVIEADSLSDQVKDLVLAAFEGAEELERALGGAAVVRAEPLRLARPDPGQIPGVFLKSISVRGFRGIGPTATLDLQPGRGLVLVVGRNGSGKSSFAEAAEFVLTNRTERAERGKVWRDGWRNVHRTEAPRIELELTVEGSRRSYTVVREWPADNRDITAGTTQVLVHSESPRPFAELAWHTALTDYRPFLAYSELSGLITNPNSEIFDALAPILGLDDLTDADQRLQKTHSAIKAAAKAAGPSRTALLAALTPSDDPRAATVIEALSKASPHRWDLEAATTAACGPVSPSAHPVTGVVGPTEDEVTRLRDLAALTVPAATDVAARADGLRAAVKRVADLDGTPAAEARRLASLLTAGLDHHHTTGDGPCPVCGTGTLDGAWRTAATAEVNRLRGLATEADAAVVGLDAATRTALALVADSPPALARANIAADRAEAGAAAELDELTAQALAAWRDWSRMREVTTPGQLADELGRRYQPLTAAVDALRAIAAARLAEIETAWTPLARRVLEWVAEARPVQERQPLLTTIENARKFLGVLTKRLRDERLAPFAEQLREIWTRLRQESNVDLGPISLEGTSTRRRLRIDATVDGVGGEALGVMSQGELHALGLAMFLPRATRPESPFRFVVIDDPVQAMDPAKVDGLAQVLLEKAKQRQVVVFTHDDRLADAVRRFSKPDDMARRVEVFRREGSVVEPRTALDPAAQCLKDADALARTDSLPDDVKAGLIPALCKSAVDAVCADVFRRRRLASGASHPAVEKELEEAKRTITRAALAIHLDRSKDSGVLGWVNRQWGSSYGDTLKVANVSGHQPYGGDYLELVKDTRALVRKFEALR